MQKSYVEASEGLDISTILCFCSNTSCSDLLISGLLDTYLLAASKRHILSAESIYQENRDPNLYWQRADKTFVSRIFNDPLLHIVCQFVLAVISGRCSLTLRLSAQFCSFSENIFSPGLPGMVCRFIWVQLGFLGMVGMVCTWEAGRPSLEHSGPP